MLGTRSIFEWLGTYSGDLWKMKSFREQWKLDIYLTPSNVGIPPPGAGASWPPVLPETPPLDQPQQLNYFWKQSALKRAHKTMRYLSSVSFKNINQCAEKRAQTTYSTHSQTPWFTFMILSLCNCLTLDGHWQSIQKEVIAPRFADVSLSNISNRLSPRRYRLWLHPALSMTANFQNISFNRQLLYCVAVLVTPGQGTPPNSRIATRTKQSGSEPFHKWEKYHC